MRKKKFKLILEINFFAVSHLLSAVGVNILWSVSDDDELTKDGCPVSLWHLLHPHCAAVIRVPL